MSRQITTRISNLIPDNLIIRDLHSYHDDFGSIIFCLYPDKLYLSVSQNLSSPALGLRTDSIHNIFFNIKQIPTGKYSDSP